MEEGNPKLMAIDNRGKLGRRVMNESDNKRKLLTVGMKQQRRALNAIERNVDVKQVETKTCSRK